MERVLRGQRWFRAGGKGRPWVATEGAGREVFTRDEGDGGQSGWGGRVGGCGGWVPAEAVPNTWR